MHYLEINIMRSFIIANNGNPLSNEVIRNWINILGREGESYTIEGSRTFCPEEPDLYVDYGDGLKEPILNLEGYLASHPKEYNPILNG